MRRRELLTGALAAAAGGCAAQRIGSDAASIELATSRFDRVAARISNPFGSFVARETNGRGTIPERQREVLAGSLRTMLLFGRMHDLPRSARTHPEITDRLRAIVPEGARSLHRITTHLERLAPSERILLQRGLASDRELPLRAAEHLDRLAVAAELGHASRLKLRGLATDTAWRLGHQPVSLLLDETTNRMHKAVRRAGEWSRSERMMLAARMQEESEWVEEAEYEEYYGEEDEIEVEEVREREPRPWRGRGMAIAGGAAGVLGIVGGYASLLWAYGNALGNDSQAGPIALAVISGLTFVVGVVVMIVGLVIKSREDAEWLERNPKPKGKRRR